MENDKKLPEKLPVKSWGETFFYWMPSWAGTTKAEPIAPQAEPEPREIKPRLINVLPATPPVTENSPVPTIGSTAASSSDSTSSNPDLSLSPVQLPPLSEIKVQNAASWAARVGARPEPAPPIKVITAPSVDGRKAPPRRRERVRPK